MVYTETYHASDISPVVVDLLVGVGAGLFAFVTLLGLLFLWRWIKGKPLVK